MNECVYFTFFSISAALASLASTLVWSTMLSVDTQRTGEKEKVAGEIRVSDSAPARVWARRHRTLLSGAHCAPADIYKQMHTNRASVLSAPPP